MKWVITGSRHITNLSKIHLYLDELLKKYGKPEVFIHGDCVGVDIIGGHWANINDIPVEKYPAEWSKYGKKAGPIRNQHMASLVSEQDLCIGIWNGKSRGTQHMLMTCESKGVPIELLKIEDEELA